MLDVYDLKQLWLAYDQRDTHACKWPFSVAANGDRFALPLRYYYSASVTTAEIWALLGPSCAEIHLLQLLLEALAERHLVAAVEMAVEDAGKMRYVHSPAELDGGNFPCNPADLTLKDISLVERLEANKLVTDILSQQMQRTPSSKVNGDCNGSAGVHGTGLSAALLGSPTRETGGPAKMRAQPTASPSLPAGTSLFTSSAPSMASRPASSMSPFEHWQHENEIAARVTQTNDLNQGSKQERGPSDLRATTKSAAARSTVASPSRSATTCTNAASSSTASTQTPPGRTKAAPTPSSSSIPCNIRTRVWECQQASTRFPKALEREAKK